MMKKIFKRLVTLCLCMMLCCSVSLTTYAATTYKNHYTNGNITSSFTITTTSSISQFTVQTQDFPSGTSVAVDVLNSSGTQLNAVSAYIVGNGKMENISLRGVHPAGTYTIRYRVNLGGSGWIGIWLY